MWKNLIALAVTIPMSITIASAQHSNDADISAYSQDLQMRINYGQQSGQLTPANYNSLQSLYNNVEMIRRSMGNKQMPPMTRYTMMDSLTKLDQQLTNYLHDDSNARWQNWNPTTKTWRNNWWTNSSNRYRLPGSGGNFGGGGNNFNDEIDAYQNNLRQRMDQGRSSGRLSRSELARLSSSYTNIENMQRQYRVGGFNSMERNSLMGLMTQFDREITAELRDNNNSRYNNWNASTNTWNNSWWKNGNTGIVPPVDRNNDGRPDWNRGRDNDRNNDGRPDWKPGPKNDNNRPDWKPGPKNDRDNDGRPNWNPNVNTSSNPNPNINKDRNNDGRPDWNHNGNIDRNKDGRPDEFRGGRNDRDRDGRPDFPTRSGGNPSGNSTPPVTPPIVTPPVTSTPPVVPPVVTPPVQSTNPPNTNPRGNDGPRGGGAGGGGWSGTRGEGGGGRGDGGGRGGNRDSGNRPDKPNP